MKARLFPAAVLLAIVSASALAQPEELPPGGGVKADDYDMGDDATPPSPPACAAGITMTDARRARLDRAARIRLARTNPRPWEDEAARQARAREAALCSLAVEWAKEDEAERTKPERRRAELEQALSRRLAMSGAPANEDSVAYRRRIEALVANDLRSRWMREDQATQWRAQERDRAEAQFAALPENRLREFLAAVEEEKKRYPAPSGAQADAEWRRRVFADAWLAVSSRWRSEDAEAQAAEARARREEAVRQQAAAAESARARQAEERVRQAEEQARLRQEQEQWEREAPARAEALAARLRASWQFVIYDRRSCEPVEYSLPGAANPDQVLARIRTTDPIAAYSALAPWHITNGKEQPKEASIVVIEASRGEYTLAKDWDTCQGFLSMMQADKERRQRR